MVTMLTVSNSMDFPSGADGKESACNARDPGSIPGLGRSPGEGNGNPLQYFCLENPIDRGVWWAHKESDMTEYAHTRVNKQRRKKLSSL